MSRIASSGGLRQREPRVRDKGYLAFLHGGLPCIACVIEGAPVLATDARFPMEAAHQHLSIAAAGWFEQRGKRVSDRQCVNLCAYHHRLAPNACDVNQRAFWDRLGIGDGVAELCRELHESYLNHENGAEVIRKWAMRSGS